MVRTKFKIGNAEPEESENNDLPDLQQYDECDECCSKYTDYCLKCGPLEVVEDAPVQEGDPDRARNSLPAGLYVAKSSKHGKGVFATKLFKKGIRFGPYIGVKKAPTDEAKDSGYAFQIEKNGKVAFLIDAIDENQSNWMRYVNCAATIQEQNMRAFQYKNNIYYKTIADIDPNEELLVWYGNGYAKTIGIYGPPKKRKCTARKFGTKRKRSKNAFEAGTSFKKAKLEVKLEKGKADANCENNHRKENTPTEQKQAVKEAQLERSSDRSVWGPFDKGTDKDQEAKRTEQTSTKIASTLVPKAASMAATTTTQPRYGRPEPEVPPPSRRTRGRPEAPPSGPKKPQPDMPLSGKTPTPPTVLTQTAASSVDNEQDSTNIQNNNLDSAFEEVDTSFEISKSEISCDSRAEALDSEMEFLRKQLEIKHLEANVLEMKIEVKSLDKEILKFETVVKRKKELSEEKQQSLSEILEEVEGIDAELRKIEERCDSGTNQLQPKSLQDQVKELKTKLEMQALESCIKELEVKASFTTEVKENVEKEFKECEQKMTDLKLKRSETCKKIRNIQGCLLKMFNNR